MSVNPDSGMRGRNELACLIVVSTVETTLAPGPPMSQRRRRLGLCVMSLVAVLAVAAVLVRIGSHDATGSSSGLCENALHREIGSQTPTTLGVIRGWGTGLAGEYPAADAFGTASDASPGAWCWVYTGSAWALFGVAEDGTSVAFPKISGPPNEAPTGPPAYR
jgi:hypothetical protein